MNKTIWQDSIHGFAVIANSRLKAMQLIKDKCIYKGMPIPNTKDIKAIGEVPQKIKSNIRNLLSVEEIQVALYHHFKGCYCIDNFFIPYKYKRYEVDFLALRETGYAVEVEIKRSLTDVKKDLKKFHNHDSELISEVYFAMPKDIIKKSEAFIPEYAGIIEVEELWGDYHTKVLRKPKRNKLCRKWTQKEIDDFFRYSNYHIWNAKKKIIDLQNN